VTSLSLVPLLVATSTLCHVSLVVASWWWRWHCCRACLLVLLRNSLLLLLRVTRSKVVSTSSTPNPTCHPILHVVLVGDGDGACLSSSCKLPIARR
jgi:hypothetical protein